MEALCALFWWCLHLDLRNWVSLVMHLRSSRCLQSNGSTANFKCRTRRLFYMCLNISKELENEIKNGCKLEIVHTSLTAHDNLELRKYAWLGDISKYLDLYNCMHQSKINGTIKKRVSSINLKSKSHFCLRFIIL